MGHILECGIFHDCLEEWFSMRDDFAFCRGHLATSGDIFVFQDCRDGCATDIEQVEISDAAKHLKMVRKQQKNY